MAQDPTPAGVKPPYKIWTSWVGVAGVATLLGLLIPQLLPGEPVPHKVEGKSEAKDKGKLEYTPTPLPEAPNLQSLLVKLVGGTVCVLGLSVLTAFGMRRWVQSHGANGATSREMRLLEVLPLGNRCSLHLVRWNHQSILVGVDGTGIKAMLPLAAKFDEVLGETEATPAAEGATFAPPAAA